MMLTHQRVSAARPAAGRVAVGSVRPVVSPVSPGRRSAPRNVVVRDAKKIAEDLLKKGVDAAKNVDVDQLKAAATGAATMSAQAIKGAIDTALSTWSSYDKDNDGKLTITEAVALLNSPEVAAAVTKATGLEHTVRTEDEVKKWFERADFDHSGSLSKREFVVFYVGLLAHKAKLGAGGLASALCTALDSDGDGKIGTSEFKRLLAGSGLTALSNVASLIPDGKEVDYRSLLAKVK